MKGNNLARSERDAGQTQTPELIIQDQNWLYCPRSRHGHVHLGRLGGRTERGEARPWFVVPVAVRISISSQLAESMSMSTPVESEE